MCLTGHQGNANRNRHEPSPQTCQNGHRQKTSDPQCRGGCGATGPRARLAGPWTGAGPVGNSVRVPRTIEKQPPVIERLLSWTPVRGKQTSHGGGTPEAQPIAHHGQGVHRRVNTGGVTHAVGSVTTCTYPCVMTPATSWERMSTPCAHTGAAAGGEKPDPAQALAALQAPCPPPPLPGASQPWGAVRPSQHGGGTPILAARTEREARPQAAFLLLRKQRPVTLLLTHSL